MFMDPSAFEAEDIERELRDAGIEPEATAAGGSTSEFRRPTNRGREEPLRLPGKGSTTAPPLSGSHFGEVGGEGGPEHDLYHHQPRALAENLGGSIRQHKATPSYGRHSKGGGSWSNTAQGRSKMSPPPSTPLSDNSVGGSYGFRHGDDGGGGVQGGDEGKVREGSPDSYATGVSPASSSSATGVRSRARVLAQQREIQQRKRRQQALSSGGIRPSDAASLSRGLVSSGPTSALPRRPSKDVGGGGGAEGREEGGPFDGSHDGDGASNEGEESHTSFSPSVKQFSAPRQVEGDTYTSFNSNKRTSSSGLSEFERRRSIGPIGLSDSDENGQEGEDDLASANGGGRRRRNKDKAAPDMGPSTSPKKRSPTEEAHTGQHSKTGSSRGGNGGGSRRGKRPDDWDDRNRPSTKTYQWGRGSGDEEGDDAGTNDGKGGGAWRSVGRKSGSSSKSQSPVPADNQKKNNNINNDSERDGSDGRSTAEGPEVDDSSVDDSGSSRSYISSSGSPSARSSSASASRSPRRSISRGGGGRGGRRSYESGRSRGGGGSASSSRSSRSGSYRSSSASAGEGRGRRRRGSPPRRRRHDENGGRPGTQPRPRDQSRAKRSSPSPRGGGGGRAADGEEKRRHGRRHASGSPDGGQGRHRRRDSGSDRLSDSGRHSNNKGGNAAAEMSKNGQDENKRNKKNDGAEGSDERSKGSGGGGGGKGQEKKKDEEGKQEGDREESKSSGSGRKDGKAGAPSPGSGAGGKQGDGGGDGVPTAPSAAVAGAGAGPAGELEFNMAAIDLSDMKRFLMSPCPRAAGVVQCYIRRNKTRANKLFPEYTLFMKEGDRFLMCSKKRPNNATSNYLVSMRAGDLDRNSSNFLGKLRANFVGTEFQVFDDGYSPKEQTGTFGGGWGSGNHGSGSGGGTRNQLMREELGCVMYASNVLGSRGPRKMQVAIPAVSDAGVVSKWSELDGGSSKAIDRVKNRDYDGSLYMVNKPPRWNDQVGAYVLNFYGRVTMASVKNFQLVSTEDFDRIILQFGRVARDEFTMDFQYPISPFQAFAITLSSFDSKIACD